MKEISVKDLQLNPMEQIAHQWMLVTAGDEKNGYNTMTASWGHRGSIWGHGGGLPTSVIFVRPQRYTKEFVDAGEYFTLSFLPEEYRKALGYCGSKSGRDVDKIRECGFTMAAGAGGAPYMEEAELVLVCRKRYAQPMGPEFLTGESDIQSRWYPENDWHTLYIGEIVEAFVKE
jgi:flavin reductase (DIM6/NTAB) family NADH-FMN oxidoreductase RutF